MPQNKHALIRYHIIDGLLRQSDFVKTSFIAAYCFNKTGYKVSQRTIQMDIDAMKHDSFLRFFAPIEYCKKRKAYYYINQDFRLMPFQFANEEIQLLEHIYEIVEYTIADEQRYMLDGLIVRMKIMSVEYI